MMNLSIDHLQGRIPPLSDCFFKKIRAVARRSTSSMSCRPIVCICARAECSVLFRDRQAHVSQCFLIFSSRLQLLKLRENTRRFYRLDHANTYIPRLHGAVGLWNKSHDYLASQPSLKTGFSIGFSFIPSACFLRCIAAFSLCSVRSFCPCRLRL